MRQASWAGNISVVLRPSLKRKRRMRKEKTNVSAAEENKAIFRRYAEEVGNQQNFELVDEIFERYISHQPDGSTLERGPKDVKRFHREFRSAFPDFHISIEDQIAEGDKVVSHYTIRGTHQGDFRGLAPTGKEIGNLDAPICVNPADVGPRRRVGPRGKSRERCSASSTARLPSWTCHRRCAGRGTLAFEGRASGG